MAPGGGGCSAKKIWKKKRRKTVQYRVVKNNQPAMWVGSFTRHSSSLVLYNTYTDPLKPQKSPQSFKLRNNVWNVLVSPRGSGDDLTRKYRLEIGQGGRVHSTPWHCVVNLSYPRDEWTSPLPLRAILSEEEDEDRSLGWRDPIGGIFKAGRSVSHETNVRRRKRNWGWATRGKGSRYKSSGPSSNNSGQLTSGVREIASRSFRGANSGLKKNEEEEEEELEGSGPPCPKEFRLSTRHYRTSRRTSGTWAPRPAGLQVS